MAKYVCSDLHLNHFNILQLENLSLKKNKLDYLQTIEDYNNMVINHINEVVGESDTLYILGDFAFGGFSKIAPLVKQIKCKNLILIMGNHDNYSIESALQLGFKEAYRGPIYLPDSLGRIILSHYPVKEAFENDYVAYNLHGHLHGSKLDLPNYVNVNIALNHYYPLKLDDFLKQVSRGKGKSRREKWLHEWYAPYQKFNDRSRQDIVLDDQGKILLEETLSKTEKK